MGKFQAAVEKFKVDLSFPIDVIVTLFQVGFKFQQLMEFIHDRK